MKSISPLKLAKRYHSTYEGRSFSWQVKKPRIESIDDSTNSAFDTDDNFDTTKVDPVFTQCGIHFQGNDNSEAEVWLPPQREGGFGENVIKICSTDESSDVDVGASEFDSVEVASGSGVLAVKNSFIQRKSIKSKSADYLEYKPLSKMTLPEINKFVQAEAKKVHPNFSRLSEAMDKTYGRIRKPVYTKNKVYLTDVNKFPELKHYQMLKEEYGRIQKKPNKLKMNQLEVVLERELNSLMLSKQNGHPLLETVLQMWGDTTLDSFLQSKKVLGMLVLCFIYAGDAVVSNLCKILNEGDELDDHLTPLQILPTPTIVVRKEEICCVNAESGIYIYVDCEKFLRVPNMYEAVLCAFALYYVFNIDYDVRLNNLFKFFDRLNDV